MLTGLMKDRAMMLRVFTAYGQTLPSQTRIVTVIPEGWRATGKDQSHAEKLRMEAAG